MVRRDGRQDDQLRPLKISFDGLARVDGSARFSFGPIGPGVLSSISGPIEVRLAVENASQATFEVSVRPLANVPATDAKTLGANIRQLLEPSLILYQSPRSLVQLVAQALVPSSPSNEDGMMAAFVNSGTLALLNAGSVPMQGVVCAVAIGQKEGKDEYIVDPDERFEPLKSLAAHGCFAFMFTSKTEGRVIGRCVWTNWRASLGKTFDEDKLTEARKIALRAAGKVYQALFEAVSVRGGVTEVLAPGELVEEADVEEEEDEDSGDADDDDKMEI